MKRVFVLLVALTVAFLSWPNAEAAITWDPTTNYFYSISNTTVSAFHPELYADQAGQQGASGWRYPAVSVSPLGAINERRTGTLDYYFGGSDVSPYDRGYAKIFSFSEGGALPSGLTASTYYDLGIYGGPTGGANHYEAGENGIITNLTVLSQLSRKLAVDGPMTVPFQLELLGSDDFNAFYVDPYLHASYTLTANAKMTAFFTAGDDPVGNGEELEVSFSEPEALKMINLFSTIDNKSVYYLMSVTLKIETDISNAETDFAPPWGLSQDLTGPFRVGTLGSEIPITLNATVPIPGSLLLLLSGLGGIWTVRRRLMKG